MGINYKNLIIAICVVTMAGIMIACKSDNYSSFDYSKFESSSISINAGKVVVSACFNKRVFDKSIESNKYLFYEYVIGQKGDNELVSKIYFNKNNQKDLKFTINDNCISAILVDKESDPVMYNLYKNAVKDNKYTRESLISVTKDMKIVHYSITYFNENK